jgi:zinc protease
MKHLIFIILVACWISPEVNAQQIKFTEYDLDNGLHVILHQDNTTPVVTVSVMYHVGSKDEDPQHTGFAHFFEHLLFEGSDNIQRGEFMKLVSRNGGENNANTTQDRTFYYETFPSNQLEMGLWLESERMLHPRIEEVGVNTQKEVVKEEKRQRMDNSPYGKFTESISASLFNGHPYQWEPIGVIEHLDAARLADFQLFFKKHYAPGNAVLTITGDINISEARLLVSRYFKDVPPGPLTPKQTINLPPITGQIIDTTYDVNIRIPAIVTAYRVPGIKSRDSKILDLISTTLSGGASARLNRKLLDEKKCAVQVASYNHGMEDYGAFVALALPNYNATLKGVLADIDAEILRLQSDLLSEEELSKIQIQFENKYVSGNSALKGIAENLANGYFFEGNTNALNEQLALIKGISAEEIRHVARKYLDKEHRLVLYYLPKN